LSNCKLNLEFINLPKSLLNLKIDNTEIILRQYLIKLLLGENLNKAILLSLSTQKKIIYPLPHVWRKIMIEDGFLINNFLSAIVWILFVAKTFSKEIIKFFLDLFKNLFFIFFSKNKKTDKFVYFSDLSPANIPESENKENKYNIVEWFISRNKNKEDLKKICHDVSNLEKQNINGYQIKNINLHMFTEIISFFNYFIKSLFLFLIILIYALIGRWSYPIMFGEIIKYIKVKYIKTNELAQEYYFNNSNWAYRPLWTYEAEKRGAKIFFYFYSSNFEYFKTKEGYPKAHFGYETMTWSNYLVWDNYQSEFITRNLKNILFKKNVVIVGSIPFQNKIFNLNIKKNFLVSIFDVQPHRKFNYSIIGWPIEYYVSNIVKNFLIDTYEVLSNFDVTIIYKKKRNIKNLLDKGYKKITTELSYKNNFMEVDPNISVHQIIQNSKLSISIPFTAPALISKELNKPAVFYDPIKLLYSDDRAAHGIKLISDKKTLYNWVKENINI